MKILKTPDLAYYIGLLFIALFIYAAFSKVADYERFVLQLSQSPIITRYGPALAVAVPGIEIITSIFLIIDKYRMIGLYLSFGLMALFCAYIIAIQNFSDFIPCSCGGVLSMLNWTEHLIFNFVFLTLSIIAIINQEIANPPLKVSTKTATK